MKDAAGAVGDGGGCVLAFDLPQGTCKSVEMSYCVGGGEIAKAEPGQGCEPCNQLFTKVPPPAAGTLAACTCCVQASGSAVSRPQHLLNRNALRRAPSLP